MGANFCYKIYPDRLGPSVVADKWAIDVSSSLHEDGHSYSGNIGMLGMKIALWHDLKLNRDQAEEWLLENHEKFDPAQAVSFIAVPQQKETQKSLNRKKLLNEKLETEKAIYQKILEYIAVKFRNSKTKYCTCKKCGSRLNRSMLKQRMATIYDYGDYFDPKNYKGCACPVCNEGLYSVNESLIFDEWNKSK